ncbi:MAG: GFA family protein [Candidatus Dadabacteria bacterium]|nr:MAG: GFA family protein [Candidatus Dadabacteria bacterium]
MGGERLYRGSCHCGRVAIEAYGQLDSVFICNCSICSKKGYLHWLVPASAFRLLTPMSHLASYCFNTGRARHHFCRTCGAAPFFIPRGWPGYVDVNVRCLEGVDPSRLRVEYFDGRRWEESAAVFASRRGLGSC